MEDIWNTFVNAELGGLVIGTFVVIWVVRKLAALLTWKWFAAVKMAAWKIAPVFPVGLAVAGALWLPGLFADDSVGVKVIKGLLAGFMAPWARRLLKRILLDRFGVDIDRSSSTPPDANGEITAPDRPAVKLDPEVKP